LQVVEFHDRYARAGWRMQRGRIENLDGRLRTGCEDSAAKASSEAGRTQRRRTAFSNLGKRGIFIGRPFLLDCNGRRIGRVLEF